MPAGTLGRGQSVRIGAGGLCRVDELLGTGGQGEVYRVTMGKESFALKWYYPESATLQQHHALELLIRKGPPDDRFLWPMALCTVPGHAGYGYLMRLREHRFKCIVDLMKRRIDPSFRALATAGFELADSYLKLHAAGLCYRDISFGNVFFDPSSGEVLICDNDNVSVDDGTLKGVQGTIGFMAPEIMSDAAAPSTQTDLWSLAVLLFYMFMISHPLEGRLESSIGCLDYGAKVGLYGREAVFTFDPDNESNRPDPDFHQNAITFWPLYPRLLRDRFVQAFTKGIDKPYARVRESEWKSAMIRLRDMIVYGPTGAENFYDSENSGPAIDWATGDTIQLPPRLHIGKTVIMLNSDTKLFPHHLDPSRLYDFSRPIAEVTQHPTNPGLWGLRNLSGDDWTVTVAGNTKTVEPTRSVSLAPGTQIAFGASTGEIQI